MRRFRRTPAARFAAGADEAHARAVAAAIAAVAGERVEIASFETAHTAHGATAVFVGARVGGQPLRHGVGVADDAVHACVAAVVSAVNQADWPHVDRRAAA